MERHEIISFLYKYNFLQICQCLNNYLLLEFQRCALESCNYYPLLYSSDGTALGLELQGRGKGTCTVPAAQWLRLQRMSIVDDGSSARVS